MTAKSGGLLRNFEELVQAGEGLFPTEVLRALQADSLNVTIPNHSDYRAEVSPHPSPATSEWFFTSETAKLLAMCLPGRALCLGVPSVAAAKAKSGDEVTLVDISPWVIDRFELTAPQVDLRIGLPVESQVLDPGYDSAILDPPWYFPSLSHWLNLASNVVKPGGAILVPLMGELTRPSAKSDRKKMTDMASELGPWYIEKATVVYETPRFERLALERAGIFLNKPWRRADLLRITNANPSPAPRASKASATNWSTLRVGNSLVSIRDESIVNSIDDRGQLVLSGLGPEQSFVLDTVSRRDPRIIEANVWTSESTAAVCSNVIALRILLESDFDRLTSLEKGLFQRVVSSLELLN